MSGGQLEKLKKSIKLEEVKKQKEAEAKCKVTAYKEITLKKAKKWFGIFSTNIKEVGFAEAKLIATLAVEDRPMTITAIDETMFNYQCRVKDLSETKEGFKEFLFWWENFDEKKSRGICKNNT